MTEAEIKLIKEKKLVELECLGIDPRLYRSVGKWLDRNYHFAVSQKYGLQVFEKNSPEKEGWKFILHPLKWDPILKRLIQVWDITKTEAYLIINEWKRDMAITLRMRDNVNKYWDFIQIPLIHEE